MKLIIDNSFCRIEGQVPPEVNQILTHIMTYKNEIEAEVANLIYKMKISKQMKDFKAFHAAKATIEKLKENEYVCLYKNQTFPTGLLNLTQEALMALNVKYEISEFREPPGMTAILRWMNTPWDPRYYQKEAITAAIAAGRGVIESAVGTGKSLMMAYLIKHFSVKSLVIVPSRGLSGQLYNDFSEWFGAANVELLDAAKIRKTKKPKSISIVTVQSLGSLQKSGEFAEFAKHIDGVFVDEVHHAGASTYTGLLADLQHVYYRFGFSGTFMRNDAKTLEMWSFLSNVIYQFPAHRAIQEGYLTPMDVYMYQMEGRPKKKYQKEYDEHYCGNPQLLQVISEIVSSYKTEQILILVNKKDKCGMLVHEYLKSLGIDNSYISGDNDKDEINNTIKAFNEKQIRVLIGSSVIGEGIDVRSTDHLIMCQGGKSEIAIVQAIGRAIRLFPGKVKAFIHDFKFEGSKYLEKHSLEREQIYLRNFNCPVYHG